MSDIPGSRVQGLTEAWRRREVVVEQFEEAWRRGERPTLEDYLPADAAERRSVLPDLVRAEMECRTRAGEAVRLESYLERYPELAPDLVLLHSLQAPVMEQPCDSLRHPNLTVDGSGQEEAPHFPTENSPRHIGRYRVERILGQGGFGVVYLAHDDQLSRQVAIKVPHSRLVSRLEDAEAYLTEARTVANLDHPNIVPVYDVGTTEDCPCYVVSKYIDATDLATRLKHSPLSLNEAIELVATVADALHYAHKHGLTHRDIKPGNILLDQSGKPFVSDFGLALREQDVGKGPVYAGTPAYMSPEQARGEGHRVDGRSDIFSLGVVLYEMLTGRRPFKGVTLNEFLEHITSGEARPPRQIDDRIPKELERICLKALSKRSSERYTTAKDMAHDLRQLLAETSVEEKATVTGRVRNEAAVATPLPSPGQTPSHHQTVKIVPKGLRSFDAEDADFFLELFPGPRDRDGFPDIIRFWKTRIETTDTDDTFAVGLIYGPSGCGKSSLVKAGLLPRLAKSITAIYVEATGEETEARLLKGLRRRLPNLPSNLGLLDSLAALRQGRSLQPGQKVLLVLDQFEQWLHAHRQEARTELVQALRQCDGGRLQCIVMVRDDFWMAVTRFMANLEIALVQGLNCTAIDLFDLIHAKKVLTAFGRAFGDLPEKELAKYQDAFLDQAVAGLAQDSKVISVRMALFAEMVKGKPWTPTTLKEVGGMEGVGVTFLEETFSSSTGPPHHRFHQKAAQAVLKALLPETGTNIKGKMGSEQDLLAASGYVGRPKDFGELVRILDGELRLITPTDPEGVGAESQRTGGSSGKSFQLTHDYLVSSLRDWLTRKQKETRRGRAELLLADRAVVWNARPENRQLPSLWQWCFIWWLTKKKNWTPPQRKMMQKASRHQAVRGAVVALLLAVATATGLVVSEQVVEQRNTTRAAGLVQSLLNADTVQVPAIIRELSDYRTWVDPLLKEENDREIANSRQKLHASLALLPVDSTQVDYLYGQMLEAEPHQVLVIRDALNSQKVQLLDKLWAVMESPADGKESQRLRAAVALAKYDPESAKWSKGQESVGNDLVSVPAVYLSLWVDALRPVRTKLLPQLSAVCRDGKRRETERSLATDILADYAADQPHLLADLLMDADEKQFAVLFPKFKAQGERGLPVLTAEVDQKLASDAKDNAKEKLAKRQANAAVALLRMNQPAKTWQLLRHSPDPRVRSYLIHRLPPLGADAGSIIKRLDEEPDITIRRALFLSLGEFGEKGLPPDARKALLPRLQEIYRTASDPGLHASVEWLLRHWHEEAWLVQTEEAWTHDKEQRKKRLEGIQQELAEGKGKSQPKWYLTGQGQTMVVIPDPVRFLKGLSATEAGIPPGEPLPRRRIGFAIAAKPVTVKQYLQRRQKHIYRKQDAPTEDCPVHATTWYMAAEYCNWLSEDEGMSEKEWCYLPNKDGQYAEGMKLRANYPNLSGYRLPTQTEWEYACRAGALTSRYYGESEELLGNYAWYSLNAKERSWPVGSLKPNDLGLFDMHGNVWVWCQDRDRSHEAGEGGKAFGDNEDVTDKQGRIWRGGSYVDRPSLVRSASFNGGVPTLRFHNVGFRPARSLAP